MNILIIGSGGREHAFAWKIKQSQHCKNLYVAPGNAGTASIASNIEISPTDFEKLGQFCLTEKIELIIVGPEAPLVEGIRDYFEADSQLKHIAMVGPGKLGAQLEGSKDFSKAFMLKHGVPTARAKTFTINSLEDSLAYIDACKTPIVLKADGLAAGKGVIITSNPEEAKETMHDMLANKMFGDASTKVLIEEFLDGIELSVFVLTDGKDYVILPEAKDYKRIGEKDTGPNTGGMGAVSPVIFADDAFMKKVEEQVVKPTIKGLQAEGINYRGFIFIGLMNVGGKPFVIEYNVRMGDPETQVVLPRIENDLVELLLACAKAELGTKSIKQKHEVAATVCLVSGGYPGNFEKGKKISGLQNVKDALVFHAGTKLSGTDVLSNGGRVLAVTGIGASLEAARQQAYDGANKLCWENIYYRKDIGLDLLSLAIK
ncbi:MAG TPA: phosphoribosylamine--glycine ligase [Cyclobacteriaceae bacterium]|nr:phosphoribosylamine--glycine ligase [Cyclobacteriaceae bacterium]